MLTLAHPDRAPRLAAPSPAAAAAPSHRLSDRALSIALCSAVLSAVFEGPLRYALNLAHLDALIFVRDGLLVFALAAFVAARLPARSLPASVAVFVLLAAVHGLVSVLNIRSLIPAAYGLKMFVPALCGFLAPQAIFGARRGLVGVMAVAWAASVAGATVDKFWIDYPWVGMNVDMGGLSVYLGRDWQSGSVERVGGLTRSSINLAVTLPLLGFVLLTSLRNRVLRAAVCAGTAIVLVWTTQKGAILGYVLAVLALLLSTRRFTAPLKLAIVAATFLMVFAPTVLVHFDMPRDAGVFSFESLFERIEEMWPDAWRWIGRFSPLTGVGLGGIGGSQRFFAAAEFNPADNLFVYLFASFGVASLAYLAAVLVVGLNARIDDFRRDGVALASLVFLLMYGLVISLVEDQVAALWLGATLGHLAQRQPAFRGDGG